MIRSDNKRVWTEETIGVAVTFDLGVGVRGRYLERLVVDEAHDAGIDLVAFQTDKGLCP